MDAPTISPGYSIFSSGPQTVTITSGDPNATIYATTNGSIPDPLTTPAYTGPLSLSSSALVQAIAVNGSDISPVAASQIVIDSLTTNISRSGMLLWLRADVGVQLIASKVSTWKDVSGSQLDATQATAGNRPSYNANAINGLPSVVFTSSSSSYLTLPSGFADFTAGFSAFVVLKPTSVGSTARIMALGNNQSYASAILITTQSTGLTFDTKTASQQTTTVTAPPPTLNSFQLIEILENSTIGQLRTNSIQGGLNQMMNSIPNTSRSGSCIGTDVYKGSYLLNGEVAELILYDRGLTDEERQYLEIYFALRYALPSIPAPTIEPVSGVFDSPTDVSISFVDENFDLFYSLTGLPPDQYSTPYSAPFELSQTSLVQAIAIDGNGNSSNIAKQYVTFDPATAVVHQDGLLTWLRSDSGILSVSGKTFQWGDLSGNQCHASQPNATNQPDYLPGSPSVLPSISFGAGNQFQFLQFPSGFADFTEGLSFFIVIKSTDTTTFGRRIIDLGLSTGNASDVRLNEDVMGLVAFYTYDPSQVSTPIFGSSLLQNVRQLVEATTDGNAGDGTTNGTLYLNGTALVTQKMKAIPNVTRTNCFLGREASFAGSAFHGEMFEVLLYNKLLDDASRKAIEDYLLARYLTARKPPAPLLSLQGGKLSQPALLAICGSDGGVVRLTRDGSPPSAESELYSGPIKISYSQTINAINIVDGVSSDIVSASFLLDPAAFPAPDAGDTTAPATILTLPSL